MRKKNLMSPFLAAALAVSMLGNYGNIAVYAESEAAETEVTESTTKAAEDHEAEAQQLMKDLTGSMTKAIMRTGLAPVFPQNMIRPWYKTVLNFSAQRICLSKRGARS